MSHFHSPNGTGRTGPPLRLARRKEDVETGPVREGPHCGRGPPRGRRPLLTSSTPGRTRGGVGEPACPNTAGGPTGTPSLPSGVRRSAGELLRREPLLGYIFGTRKVREYGVPLPSGSSSGCWLRPVSTRGTQDGCRTGRTQRPRTSPGSTPSNPP